MSSKERKDKYNKTKWTEKGNKGASTSREKYAPFADIPTIAAALPGLKIPEALLQVDPQKLSQVLPEMYKQFMQMRNLMSAFNSRGGFGGGSGTSNSSSVTTNNEEKDDVIKVFKGAMARLSRKYGFLECLAVITEALSDGKYVDLLDDYEQLFLEVVVEYVKMGEENNFVLPVNDPPVVVYGLSVPTPLIVDAAVPDFYIKQYYLADLDPYPGYIKWVSQDGLTSYYVKRTSTDYPFESALDEVQYTLEVALAAELDPYFENKNLTVAALNIILPKYHQSTQQKKMEQGMGKNSTDRKSVV